MSENVCTEAQTRYDARCGERALLGSKPSEGFPTGVFTYDGKEIAEGSVVRVCHGSGWDSVSKYSVSGRKPGYLTRRAEWDDAANRFVLRKTYGEGDSPMDPADGRRYRLAAPPQKRQFKNKPQ